MTTHDPIRLLIARDVGGGLDAQESRQLEAHLAGCAICRADAAGQRRDHRLLVASLADEPVAPRVRAALEAAATSRRGPSPLALLAAALLILALIAAAVLVGSRRPVLVVDPSPSASGSPSTSAGPPEVDRVSGTYTYTAAEGQPARRATVDANGTNPVSGTWSFQALPDGEVQSGPITCLVVRGSEAFLFGPSGIGERAAFMWVRDGGPGAEGDEAITWMQDLPTDPLPPEVQPQTLEEMEGWCRNAGAGYPGLDDPGQVPLDSGSLTVNDTP